MIDKYGREITYLRISVTDRCNFRCVYCMPEEGVPPKPHASILRYEEITRIARLAISLGIRSIRVTGGEPLVRKGLGGLVAALNGLRSLGLRDLSMTTNASLLAPVAGDLKAAGLDRVNISLDTLRSDRFRSVTRGGDLTTVLEGAGAALAAGLWPVKMNVVVTRDNIDEVQDFALFGMMTGLVVRFIELMPLGYAGSIQPASFVDTAEMMERLEPDGGVAEVMGVGPGSGPARYHTWTPRSGLEPSAHAAGAIHTVRDACGGRPVGGRPGAPAGGSAGGQAGAPVGGQGMAITTPDKALVGFITSVSRHSCPGCNRLRLTADGRIAPCLWSSDEIDLGAAMRAGASDAELTRVIGAAVMAKPLECGASRDVSKRRMSRLGG